MAKSVSPSPFWEDKILILKRPCLGPLKNNQGQTLITWLVMLSLLLLVTIVMGSGMGLIQNRMQVVNICRLESLNTQRQVEPILKQLFSLNPRSRLLRLKMIAAQARLAAALAHYNFIMAARAKADIAQIKNQQQILDRMQSGLVNAANLALYKGTMATYLKLKTTFVEIKERSSGWAQVHFILNNPRVPKLAVKREDQFLAPAFIVKDNFEKQQTTTQSWSQNYHIKGFFETDHRSKSQCNATLEENTWVPKIRRDKLF